MKIIDNLDFESRLYKTHSKSLPKDKIMETKKENLAINRCYNSQHLDGATRT